MTLEEVNNIKALALMEAAEKLRKDPTAEYGTSKFLHNAIYAAWLDEKAKELTAG